MKVGLIIIGDEILSGKRQDKHLAKVIELLSTRGMGLSWARYLGDERQQIALALREAWASGDLVFSCGGIGATPDDHTRQAAAIALGLPLVLHPLAKERIWQRTLEMAAEKGESPDADHPDTLRRFQMGEFPEGAAIIENPFNRIPGFSLGHLHCVPGFPVMAHPMIESLLDGPYAHLHRQSLSRELSVIVQGAMEAALTPLMEAIEADFPGIKVFSLPSVDHPQWGRHIELGVKGEGEALSAAYAALKTGLNQFGAMVSAELVR